MIDENTKKKKSENKLFNEFEGEEIEREERSEVRNENNADWREDYRSVPMSGGS